MSGFISVRVTREERKKLIAFKVERDCRTLSQAVRLLCGFPRGVDEGIDGADDFDSVAKLVHEVVLMIDRLDTNNKLLYKLSQEVAELQGKPHVRRKDIPVEDLVKPNGVPRDLAPDSRRHPALPAGFAR